MFGYQYPARLTPSGEGSTIISFRDIPEAITEIWNDDELQDTGRDAIMSAMEFYIEDRREFPAPSAPENGEALIMLPLSVIAKILLLNAMVAANVRPADLARKMHVKPQDVTRLLNLRHATKIDTIQAALNTLGRGLQLTLC